MTKTETLKDGTKVTIRKLTLKDLNGLMKFYLALPEQDRKYLRVDVTNRAVVEQRIKLLEHGNVFRIIALHGGDIVADGALELAEEEWKKHQGELRVIVARPFQHKGLGLIMMKELYHLAIEKNVETVVVQMMRPQIAAINICRKLGFHEEVLIPDYVRDLSGKPQDLVIMKSNIKDLIKEIEYFYSDSDWERCR